MDIRTLTPTYAVTPQIDPADMVAISDAGFGTIICNRPNAEIPPSHHDDVMAAAAAEAGIKFVVLPVTHQSMTLDLVTQQAEVLASADTPVLAYCASGTRSTIVWALGQAKTMAADDIIAAAAKGGYDIAHLRSQLDTLAQA